MKLLFDQNLSPALVVSLSDLFPDSNHVFLCGMHSEDDRDVRAFAHVNDFVIVTKDADYSDLSMLLGYPPKVIWIRSGNCSTNKIEQLLREHFEEIEGMFADPNSAMITIY